MKNRIKQFLTELSLLSVKYDIEIEIDGCGCCDSPYLKVDGVNTGYGVLTFDREEKIYTVYGGW